MRPAPAKPAVKVRRVSPLVMLSLVVVVACSVFAAAPKYPAYKGHVNDFAGVIDDATENQLATILLNFEKRTGTQIGVVTIKTLGETPIEDYANGLYRAWGIGAKTGANKNKGALLLVATEDRRSRLEVGYGLEGDLPDGLAGEMLRRMRPYFKQMNWSEGLTVGVRTLVDTLAQKWGVSLEGIDQSYAYTAPESSPASSSGSGLAGILCLVIALVIIILAVVGASRGGGGGRGGTRRRGGGVHPAAWLGPLILNRGGGGFGGGSFGGSSGGSWGGGGGGGGSWGGFGGGSSGGGGASDSW